MATSATPHATPRATPRMEDEGEGAGQPAQSRQLSRTVPSSSQAEARAQSINAARDKLQAGVSIARTALQEFGSIASVASIQAIEKRVQTTKKRHIKSPFCRVEKEEAKTDLMNAACGVYQLLYAPKGHTNNMHAAEWAISRVRSLAWAFLFAVLGVIVAVWENEVLWANNRVPSIQSFWLKVLCVVLTAVSLYFIRNYYRAVIAQERLRGIPLHNGHVSMLNLQSIGIWWQALLDLICLLPMPIPFLMYEFEVYNDTTKSSVTYQLDVLLTVFMFLRIRLFPRFFGECLSGVGTDSARAYGNISRLVMGESFIFKYLITSNLSMVLTLWFTQIVFFGYCLMLFERPMSFNPIAHSQLHEIASALWCTVITMTIVGYGDVYPQTRLDRCTMMVASISALIMVAISTNIVKVLLTMSRAEEKCMQVLGMMETRDDVKIKAAELIQAAWRAYALPVKEGARSRPRAGRKLLDNDDFLARAWEFAHASRSFYNDRCSVAADDVSMVGVSLSTAARVGEKLDEVETSLASTLKSLETLRA